MGVFAEHLFNMHLFTIIMATFSLAEAHWGGSKHLKKSVVASPYPLRSPGVEDCRTVEDDVLEERCSTTFSSSCHREVDRKCRPVEAKECYPKDEENCSLVFDHKCKKISFPKCKISWEKTCTEEPICSQTFEDVSMVDKKVCVQSMDRQCHTEMERVCTKEAVTHVPEKTRVLPRVIEVPMTQVPTKVDVDVFVRSLESDESSEETSEEDREVQDVENEVEEFEDIQAEEEEENDIPLETGDGKRTKRFAHLKQKILNKKAAKWEKIEAKKAAKWAKINAKKQGGLVVDTHVDFVDVCREVPQERCVENPIERCHNEPIQDCKKVAKQNCVTAEKCSNLPQKKCEMVEKEKCIPFPSKNAPLKPKFFVNMLQERSAVMIR